jgi:acyl-CoA reductase-like NAD-dependent aldehyde dehydrogenase
MRQRDDALQQIKDLIKQKNDDIMEEESKINGIKNETKRAQ